MSISNNLQNLIAKQQDTLTELEQEVSAILNSDTITENESLKKEVEKLKVSVNTCSEKLKSAANQNVQLKNALFEQIYNEKIKIINTALKKNDIYFRRAADEELNKLAWIERDLKHKTDRLVAEMDKYRTETSDDLYMQFNELSSQVSTFVSEARAKIAKETGAFTAHSARQFEDLKNEQITDETIAAIGQKNNWEAFVGGNLINKLGILFVILGIIAVSRFTFFHLPDTFKGIIMFAVSGCFLLAGELLNRRKPDIFSLGITSAGVAGIYVSLSISYFILDILSMYPALGLCILITVGAFVLSRRYNAQTIAAFALIGGYIPIVSISGSTVLIYGAMIYFVMLNLFALSISFYNKWRFTMFMGFFLNFLGTLYIIYSMSNLMHITTLLQGSLWVHQVITLLYVLFAFAVYTVIPIAGNFRNKQALARPDIIILGINTVLSALTLYHTFRVLGLSDFEGLAAFVFAVIYIGLGRFMETRFASSKRITALFYLTGLAFVILIIPLQFGKAWLSLGWLAQGTALAAYGILTGEKSFQKAGGVIGVLCLAAFLLFDVFWGLFLGYSDLFVYKYLAITLGSTAILACLAYKKSLSSKEENIYKYAVLLNVWFYCLYAVSLLDDFLRNNLEDTAYSPGFLMGALGVSITFVYGFLLPRIPVLLDRGVKFLSAAISALGMLLLFAVTSTIPLMQSRGMASAQTSMPEMILASFVLLVLGGLAVLSMRSVLMFLTLEARMPVEWLPFGLSSYFLVILTQTLVTQYNLEVTSIAISILYVAAALAWIIYGFVRRFSFMRRFGLGLSVLAVAKLFLVDLPGLTQGYKILSYFAFGAALLGISFVYQYFSKRLISKRDGDVDVSEENDV